MDTVSVNSGRSNVRQITVPDLIGVLGKCDSLEFTFASLVEQAQLDFGGVSRKESEVCTLAVGRPTLRRKDAADLLEPRFFSFPS